MARVALDPAAAVMVWAIVGLFLVNVIFGITNRGQLPTERFLTSGGGQVLDVGAGSGGGQSTCCSLDPDNRHRDRIMGHGHREQHAERFMTNARIAGAAQRADAIKGDARELPFGDATYDAVVACT